MERYPLVPEKPYPLIERIKREGGVELDLGGGKTGFATLELRNEEAMEGQELPTKSAMANMKDEEKEKLGGFKVREVEKKRAVFIDDADRNFKAAFPGRDRFARDLSDAPEELKQSLATTYEALSAKIPEALSEVEQLQLKKLKSILDAAGYVPKLKAVVADAKVGGAAPVPKKVERVSERKVTPREREESRRKLERFVDHPHWLVTKPEVRAGKAQSDEGIAVKVHPWYAQGKKRGELLGFRVIDGYASPWIKTDLKVGDILLVDRQMRLLGRTDDGKTLPDLFLTDENAVKLNNMYENDRVRLDADEAPAKKGIAAAAK